MSDKVKSYWKLRCARWGEFETSGKNFSATNWHRLINGTPHNHLNDDVVRDLSEQAETAVFIRQLERDEQALAFAAFAGYNAHKYGMTTTMLQDAFLSVCMTKLERMRKQRLNGESINPMRRVARPRIAKIKIDRTTVAATCNNE